jgi:hypothetical protein
MGDAAVEKHKIDWDAVDSVEYHVDVRQARDGYGERHGPFRGRPVRQRQKERRAACGVSKAVHQRLPTVSIRRIPP